MSREVELLIEIRDLLQVIAEPALAKRDEILRNSLRRVVGGGAKKAKAVMLMDGTRPQAVIVKESGIDHGDLSRLVKALAAARLIVTDNRNPTLLVKVPPTFFNESASDES
jgi:hypothetical protein